MSDKFKAVGLPENIEIDIPDKNSRRKSNSRLDEIFHAFRDDALGISGAEDNNNNDSNAEDAKKIDVGNGQKLDVNKLLSILDTISTGAFNGTLSFNVDPTTGQLAMNISENGKISTDDVSKLLDIENLWAVPCKKDPNLKQNFENAFGKDDIPLKKFDDIPLCTATSAGSDDGYLFGYMSNFKVVDYQDKYVLLYGEPNKDIIKDKYSFGAFIAMIEDPDGKFSIVLPEYGNTFDINTKMLYAANEPDDLFDDDGNFMALDIDKIEAGLNMLLYYPKDVLVSPLKFGTFTYQKEKLPENVKSVDRIKIGVLTDNGSADASLFKKDFDLDPNKTVFDFYVKFSSNMTAAEANAINEMFAKDATNSAIFTDSELKADGDDLYITFDTDSFAGLLDKWLRE